MWLESMGVSRHRNIVSTACPSKTVFCCLSPSTSPLLHNNQHCDIPRSAVPSSYLLPRAT
jgi:hypothetical protein